MEPWKDCNGDEITEGFYKKSKSDKQDLYFVHTTKESDEEMFHRHGPMKRNIEFIVECFHSKSHLTGPTKMFLGFCGKARPYIEPEELIPVYPQQCLNEAQKNFDALKEFVEKRVKSI